MRRPAPFSRTVRSSATPERSTTRAGLRRPFLSWGSRSVPPARSLAAGPRPARAARHASTLSGVASSNRRTQGLHVKGAGAGRRLGYAQESIIERCRPRAAPGVARHPIDSARGSRYAASADAAAGDVLADLQALSSRTGSMVHARPVEDKLTGLRGALLRVLA